MHQKIGQSLILLLVSKEFSVLLSFKKTWKLGWHKQSTFCHVVYHPNAKNNEIFVVFCRLQFYYSSAEIFWFLAILDIHWFVDRISHPMMDSQGLWSLTENYFSAQTHYSNSPYFVYQSKKTFLAKNWIFGMKNTFLRGRYFLQIRVGWILKKESVLGLTFLS